jgi:hypothetical protein
MLQFRKLDFSLHGQEKELRYVIGSNALRAGRR